jgi:hypothetical protein
VVLGWAVLVAGLIAPQARAIRCLTWQVPEITGVAPEQLPPPPKDRELPCDYTPVGPPPDPQIGDTWDWYIWSLNGPPEAELKPCTVRGMGEHHYVVVEDSAWGVSINQADVDRIVDYMENQSVGQWPDKGVWELNTQAFGDPPDNLDQDGKIYLLYYEFDVSSDGFFWYFDQFCDGTQPYASNECDVIYMSTAGQPPAGDYMLAVMSHEFQHLIHFNYDTDEASWVNEGMGELAMWLFGHPDQISGFNNNPDNSLNNFGSGWADYIKTYLWSLYFFERYGGFEASFNVVHEPANSITGYENVLDAMGYTENFADVFADWTVANYLDDTTIADGRYGYEGEDLPAFRHADDFDSYPVFGQQRDVNHWATDYMGFTQADALDLSFDGADNTEFAVHVIEIDDTGEITVERMPLDSAQSGAATTTADGDEDDLVVLVVAGAASGGGKSYQVDAFRASGATATPGPSPTATAAPASPTPTPTPTPAVTATPTAEPEPTIPGDAPWIELELNAEMFHSGDQFLLTATYGNPWPQDAEVRTYIVLDVYGSYWFWPTWCAYPDCIDWEDRTLTGASQFSETVLEFPWPSGSGSGQDICFHAILMDPETQELLCDLSSACFSFNMS